MCGIRSISHEYNFSPVGVYMIAVLFGKGMAGQNAQGTLPCRRFRTEHGRYLSGRTAANVFFCRKLLDWTHCRSVGESSQGSCSCQRRQKAGQDNVGHGDGKPGIVPVAWAKDPSRLPSPQTHSHCRPTRGRQVAKAVQKALIALVSSCQLGLWATDHPKVFCQTVPLQTPCSTSSRSLSICCLIGQ